MHEVKDKGLGYPGLTRFAPLTKDYADACVEVGQELGITTLDSWSLFMSKAGWVQGQTLCGSLEAPKNETLQSLFTDGVHLSGQGYRVIFDALMELIKNTWPDETPENLRLTFPLWNEFSNWERNYK